MKLKRVIAGIFILLGTVAPRQVCAAASVGSHDYIATVDDIAGRVRTFGQLIIHRGHDVQLSETVRQLPIFSIQYAGLHYRQGPAGDPNHVAARAKCLAEHLVHAWTLMDHGAQLEIGTDDWSAYTVRSQGVPPKSTAIFIRTPLPDEEPLRIITIYPQDVAGYPWISNERSLAEYLASLIQAHYYLFWKNESDISRYDELRIAKTGEGRIFRDIAVRALELAQQRDQIRFDGAVLKEALAGMSLSQRETLYRLATTPPMDWEASSR